MPSNRGVKKISNIRRLAGRKVLDHVPVYHFEGDGTVPVTQARIMARELEIPVPAIITIKRTEFTTDRFFRSKKGMFGVDYVEYNYFNFQELVDLERNLVADGKITSEPEKGYLIFLPGCEYEVYSSEYAFV